MKTTVELPDALMKQVRLRAIHEGRKLKDAIAHFLRKGLAVVDEDSDGRTIVIAKDKKTGLPGIECVHAASAQDEATPERVAEALLSQEVEWQNDTCR